MQTKLLAFGIMFMTAGLAFCAVSVFLRLRDDGPRKSPLSAAHSMFLVIGALTLAMGILAVLFRSELTAKAVGIGAVVYLALLTVLLWILTILMKGTGK